MISVSVIIVNFNGYQFTRDCIKSLTETHSLENIEIIIVDNNSSDGSAKKLSSEFSACTIISLPENKGFGFANNRGAEIAEGEHLFFINNDTLFVENSADTLAQILESHQNIGVVAPKLLNEDGTFQLSFGKFPAITTEMSTKKISSVRSLQLKEEPVSNEPIKVDWVSGAALMIKKTLFRQLNGFDENYFMYFEDVDLCKRSNAKRYKSIYIPSLRLIHLGGKSYGKKDSKIMYEYRRSQIRYYDKHNSLFQRIALRIFLLIKYAPQIFDRSKKTQTTDILKLIFMKQFRQ